MPAPDCLLSLIGLSEAGSVCFPLPTGEAVDNTALTASASGLYLDTVEGLTLRAGAGATAATDLYTLLAQARGNAVAQVRLALRMGGSSQERYTQRGILGGLGNGQLAPVGTRAQMSFYTNARRDGAWRITQLQLFTDQAVTDVPLLLDGAQVATISTNAAGGSAVLATGGVLVPLDGNLHRLEAVLPDGVRVKTNSFFAGCFSCQRNSPWSLAVQNSLSNVTAQTPGNGFAITVQEECTADPDFLCYATGTDEGQAKPRYPDVRQAVALAVLYKAAQLFTISLLAARDTNRYTMLEPKALNDLGSYYGSKLNSASPDGTGNYFAWLNSPEGLGRVQHPCFVPSVKPGPGLIWTG